MKDFVVQNPRDTATEYFTLWDKSDVDPFLGAFRRTAAGEEVHAGRSEARRLTKLLDER